MDGGLQNFIILHFVDQSTKLIHLLSLIFSILRLHVLCKKIILHINRIDEVPENREIVAYFLWVRGTGQSSVIAGHSVHNVRIERNRRDAKAICIGCFFLSFL